MSCLEQGSEEGRKGMEIERERGRKKEGERLDYLPSDPLS